MSKPCANTNLDINFEANGKISVFHRGSGKTYVIGAGEYSVLRELDGTKDLGMIAACTQYSEAEVGYLVRQFEKIGFLHGQEPPKKLNLIRIKKPLVNGNRMIHPEKLIWRILNFLILYFSFPVLILGLAVNAGQAAQILSSIQNDLMQPRMLIVLPITLLVLSLHEMGHAIVARCLHVNVPEIGLMLYWFMPCAYTNLSGIVFLEKRSHRLLALFAGLFVNVMLAGIGLLLLPVTAGTAYAFCLWFAVSNLSIILVNLVVFLKLDGYFILEECVGMKGLRRNAFAFVKNSIGSFVSRIQMNRARKLKYTAVKTKQEVSFMDKMIYVFYVIFSCIYLPMILLVTLLSAITVIMERFG